MKSKWHKNHQKHCLGWLTFCRLGWASFYRFSKNLVFGQKLDFWNTVCRTSVFQSYGTARYWTGEAKNKGKQKMRVWNARFWNATPRNATGLREKTKKEKKMTKFHASFMENIFKFWTSEIEFIYKWKMEIFFYRNNDFSVESCSP